MKLEGTEKDRSATEWLWWFKLVGGSSRTRRRQTELHSTPRGDEEAASFGKRPQLTDSTLPRKASSGVRVLTVPETDTGGWGEYPKALEITLVKELCKLAP